MTINLQKQDLEMIIVVPGMMKTQESQVWSLGWEDPLEQETATPASFLAWKIPWTEDPGGLQSVGSQGVRHDWADKRECGHFPILNQTATPECTESFF